MNEKTLTPEKIDALKKDILSSVHCALPGFVESFDPAAGTAVIRPGVKTRSGLELPLLRDVPVYLPAALEVSPGDLCLVVFADCDMDGWLETGEVSVPRSGRMHSLSDGFAFVGFGRRRGEEE